MKLSPQSKSLLSLLLLLSCLMVPFQNCTGSFNTTAGLVSSDSVTTSSNDMDGTVPLSQDAMNRAACAANFNAPSMGALPATSLTFNSGIAKGSGDTGTMPTITVTGTKSTKNSAIDASLKCDTYTTFSVQCSLVVDATHPATVNQAIDLSGADIMGNATTDDTKKALIMKAITIDKVCNNKVFDAAAGTAPIALGLNRTNDYVRCFKGNFQVQVSARQDVSGTRMSSASQIINVTVNDGCWDESRLKSSTELPRIAAAGSAVAIDGSWAAFIASSENMGSTLNAGAIHIFKFDGSAWVFHSVLQVSDSANDDTMTAIALKGDTLIASSAYRQGHGGVFVYKLTGNSWNLAKVIDPPDLQINQLFGFSLSYDGTNLAVGAPGYSRAAGDLAGAVYMFDANFNGTQMLSVPDANYAGKAFGSSVSVSGSTLAVGAPQATTKSNLGRGDVRIFQKSSTWTQTSIITPGTEVSAGNGLLYGAAVALSGSKLVVGAPGHVTSKGANSGAAIYFANYTMAPSKVWEGAAGDGITGTSVALGSNGILVGEPYQNTRSGYVSYYTYADPGTLAFRLISENSTANDGFGWAVGISGSNVITGARIKSDPQSSSGAAYVHKMK